MTIKWAAGLMFAGAALFAGETVAPFIGAVPLVSALPLISGGLEWLVGLAAIILLWQPASGQFYAASGRA